LKARLPTLRINKLFDCFYLRPFPDFGFEQLKVSGFNFREMLASGDASIIDIAIKSVFCVTAVLRAKSEAQLA
jgi:hypothetical protein